MTRVDVDRLAEHLSWRGRLDLTPKEGQRVISELRACHALTDAAVRVVNNAYGSHPRHSLGYGDICRDDCIPCGMSALRAALVDAGVPGVLGFEAEGGGT